MGTTITAVLMLSDVAYIAHVGDSRLYLHRKGHGLHQVTEDHSLVAEQVRNGIISEDEARHHALKNLITRAVGTKRAVDVDLLAFHVKAGDTILICSDGLAGVVAEDDIAQSLEGGNLTGAGRLLLGKALEAGGPDNVTTALVRVTKQPPPGHIQPGAHVVASLNGGLFSRLRDFFSG